MYQEVYGSGIRVLLRFECVRELSRFEPIVLGCCHSSGALGYCHDRA